MNPNKGQLFCSEFLEKMSAKLSDNDKGVLDLIEFVMPESNKAGYVSLRGSEDKVFKALDIMAKANIEAGYKGKTYVFGGDENNTEAQLTFTKAK